MPTDRVLIDTGPIVSILSESQQHHEECRDALQSIAPPLLTCWPVLTEAAYLLRQKPTVVRALLQSTDESLLQILPLTSADVAGINSILEKYEDQGFQLADAALMYLAEREQIDRVFTLDERDFLVYRNSSGKPLSIVPF